MWIPHDITYVLLSTRNVAEYNSNTMGLSTLRENIQDNKIKITASEMVDWVTMANVPWSWSLKVIERYCMETGPMAHQPSIYSKPIFIFFFPYHYQLPPDSTTHLKD